jgi:TonB family protein
MPMTETPPQNPAPSPSSRESAGLYDVERWESAYRELHVTPELVIQLQDDLSRSRQREAFWISVIVHIVVIILILNANKLAKYLPSQTVVRLTPAELAKQKQLTYLELPPDLQKPKHVNSNVISDKDRMAAARTPKVQTKPFLDSTRPGITAPRGQQPQRPAPQQQAQKSAPQQQQQQQAPPPPPKPDQNQMAKLEPPPQPIRKPNFNTPDLSAGSAIEQAARAALADRGSYGRVGDYGINQGRTAPRAVENMDILTDTMGVDFGPYLQRVLHDIKENWYNVIPESAEPPMSKKGKVAIEFVILKDGTVGGIRYDSSSGDVPLDRAAMAGITGSNPFPPLPGEFPGKYLGLRIYFFYNPSPGEMSQQQPQ